MCKLIDLMNKLIEIEPIKTEKVGIDLFHFILFGEKKVISEKESMYTKCVIYANFRADTTLLLVLMTFFKLKTK